MATEYEPTTSQKRRRRAAREVQPTPRIRAILDSVPHDATRILDLGCVRHSADRRARGDLHSQLRYRTNATVVGIDTAAEGIAAMQNEGLSVEVGDATAFDFDAKFDAVVAGDIIEHLDRPGAMLECARRNLHPNGRLVVSTPNVWCWFFMAQTFRNHVHSNEEHTCWYDERTLRQLLKRKQFAVNDITELVAPPSSVEQPILKTAFKAVGKLPLPDKQRAPTLVASATPE